MSDLGTYIAKLREERGLSQSALAQKASLTQNTIHKIETTQTKHPGIDVLVAIAKALKVPVYSLILAYQKKDPNSKEFIDKKALENSLIQSVKKVMYEHFPE